jgi:hypothetical protein
MESDNSLLFARRPGGFPGPHKQVLKVAHHAGITFRQLGRNLVTGDSGRFSIHTGGEIRAGFRPRVAQVWNRFPTWTFYCFAPAALRTASRFSRYAAC